MSLLLALSLLFSGPAQAADSRPSVPWTDVVWKGFYYLTYDLKVNAQITFPVGTKFEWADVTGGGGYVPVTAFVLKDPNCPDANAVGELFLINPRSKKGEDIGVEMRKGCEVVFYVENRLVGRPSVFTDLTE